jgi:hypothetical protein
MQALSTLYHRTHSGVACIPPLNAFQPPLEEPNQNSGGNRDERTHKELLKQDYGFEGNFDQ